MYHEMDDDSIHVPSDDNSGQATPVTGAGSPVKTNSPYKNGSPYRTRSPIKTNPSYTTSASNRFISPEKRNDSSSNLSSPARVANITAKPFSASPTRPRGISPVKAPVSPTKSTSVSDNKNRIKPNPDDSLVSSLKAQGFTETDSKSKLCYDFKEGENRRQSVSPGKVLHVSGRQRSVSPLKGTRFDHGNGPSGDSPVKNQETRGRAPTRSTGNEYTIFGYSPFRNIAPYGAILRIFHCSFSPISSPCGGL